MESIPLVPAIQISPGVWSSYRPVHSRIRQSARYGEHSNHGYFVDPWPIGNTVCLQTAFGRRWRRLRLLSAVVVGLRTPALQPMHAHRGQAFQGVTPSFRLSNYQLSKQLYFVVCPLTSYRQRTSRTHSEIIIQIAAQPGDKITSLIPQQEIMEILSLFLNHLICIFTGIVQSIEKMKWVNHYFTKTEKMLWMFSVIGIAFAFLPGLFCPALWFFSLFYAIIYTWLSILIFRRRERAGFDGQKGAADCCRPLCAGACIEHAAFVRHRLFQSSLLR
ncbi:MAG: hypothetical protein PUE14_11300 [Clostridia bacterium]|nr:hypothetical protein [Clostridia bacterium]